MNNKLWIGLVVVMFACCAQADAEEIGVEKFGDLGSGEEGFYKHCFTRMSLSNLIGAYYQEKVGDLLGSDRKLVENKLDTDFKSFGKHYACSRHCHDIIVGQVYADKHAGEQEVDASRCEQYARLNRLCDLVKAKKSRDLRVISIEKWLCSASKRLENTLYSGFFRCQLVNGYPKDFKRAAESELDTVMSYTLEELREKEKETTEKIEADLRLRFEFDKKIVQEAYSKVNKGIDQLPRYIKCSKQQAVDKAREKAERAKKEMEDRHQSELSRQRNQYEDERKKRDGDMAALGILALAALGAGR